MFRNIKGKQNESTIFDHIQNPFILKLQVEASKTAVTSKYRVAFLQVTFTPQNQNLSFLLPIKVGILWQNYFNKIWE